MLTRLGNLHLEIQTSRKNPVGILRTSFRDNASGKIRHTQHGRIAGCSLQQLKILQLAFREKVLPLAAPEAFRTSQNKEYGASRAILQLARQLELPRLLYSRPEPWVDSVMAMIAGRIVYQGSKLSLCNQWANTSLWEQCGVDGRPDVQQHCYLPLDRLLERQQAIQKKLAARHLHEGALVLYDIASSYFEDEYQDSEIVLFGYNRDGKRGHEQVVLGMVCNEAGCPIGCEVFAGNTNDSATVMEKITELRHNYGLRKIVFVGGRGMLTEARLEQIGGIEGIDAISVPTHRQIFDLVARKVIEPQLFDENRIVEIEKDDRIRAHAFLCMLAYYVQWHLVERLRPLFEADGQGADRRWTVRNVIERLRQICRYRARVSGVEFYQTTDPDDEQQTIIDLLGVTL